MLDLTRKPQWEPALSEYIVSCRQLPHQYGEHDCCTFISGAVMATCGVDPMAEFRGKYESILTAQKALKSIGAGDLPSTLDGKFPSIPVSRAKQGDIVLTSDISDMDASGVVTGRFAWFVSEEGLVSLPIRFWEKAWSIG